jgi:hypothetical protein
MSQICGKTLFVDVCVQIITSILGGRDSYENSVHGKMGEEIVSAFAHSKMGYKDTNFVQKYHGFDRVFRDGNNRLVIVESKATKVSGISALRKGQGDKGWVEKIAKKMRNRTSSLYTEENEKIGKEIQEILKVDVKNIRFLIAHVDMREQTVDVTEVDL